MDNGPESSGRRTQCLHRMVQFVDAIGKPVQLLYDPPYYSKYNPIERCWGIMGIFVYPPEKVYSREISKDYLRPYSDA